MSWQASRWARDQRTGSAAAKVVLLVLAENAGAADASSILSVATLVERTELSKRAVIQHLAALEASGLIGRERRWDTQGHRAADLIRLLIGDSGQGAPDAPRQAKSKVRETHQGEIPRCTTDTPKVHVVHSLSAGGAPHIDKGLIEGLKKGSDPAFQKADVDAIWEITPRRGRERSSRKDIERALSSAVRRGHSPADVLRGLKAYYAGEDATKDDGRYAKGCHVMIENDRWEAFAPTVGDDEPARVPVDPWRSRVQAFADPSNRYWNATDWGPLPGKPGCKASAVILAEFGFGGDNVVPLERKGAT